MHSEINTEFKFSRKSGNFAELCRRDHILLQLVKKFYILVKTNSEIKKLKQQH